MIQEKDPYLDQLRSLVLLTLKGESVKVYLYGSRARKDHRKGSDVDIAVEPYGKFDSMKLFYLKESIEESTIPYKVDIVNLEKVSSRFKEQVLKDGVLWKE